MSGELDLMSGTLIQIVPKLPPVPCGVGDYALAVARVLRSEFGIETLFLVAKSRGESVQRVEPFVAQTLESCAEESLAQALCAATQAVEHPSVLLHLSPYGYSGRGCPFWLLHGLQRWKRQKKTGRLITMFHELYVDAPPWRSIFWVSLAQRAVVARIARESHVALTNIRRYCRHLERFDDSKRSNIDVLAVPSNVGEPSQPAELNARTKSIVIFGQPASRQRAYTRRIGELRGACERLGMVEVHDVGSPIDAVPERIGGAPVIQHGRMEAHELSALLSRSMAGFVDYFPGYLAKSSIFAAYCAHRMLPVIPEDGPSEDGIFRGRHFYSAADTAPPLEAQTIADAAWNWYRGHSLRQHAVLIARSLSGTSAIRE